jgi:hypothetical protein
MLTIVVEFDTTIRAFVAGSLSVRGFEAAAENTPGDLATRVLAPHD